MNGGIVTKLKAVTEYKAPYADRHTARGGKKNSRGQLPCIISLPVSALYIIVDQIFIQKIAEESGFTADYICAALLRLFHSE